MSRTLMMPENGTASRYSPITADYRTIGLRCHSHAREDVCEHSLCAADREIADIKMPASLVHYRADRARANVLGARAGAEIARQAFDRHRQKALERVQRLRV